MINITLFIVLKDMFFSLHFPSVVNLTKLYYPIFAIIIIIILWWVIRLSRKNNESKFLFLINCILAVFNSFSLLFPILFIFSLMIFGTGDSS